MASCLRWNGRQARKTMHADVASGRDSQRRNADFWPAPSRFWKSGTSYRPLWPPALAAKQVAMQYRTITRLNKAILGSHLKRIA
jgi:hypothetical protein